jgi:hypothetical protein
MERWRYRPAFHGNRGAVGVLLLGALGPTCPEARYQHTASKGQERWNACAQQRRGRWMGCLMDHWHHLRDCRVHEKAKYSSGDSRALESLHPKNYVTMPFHDLAQSYTDRQVKKRHDHILRYQWMGLPETCPLYNLR